MLKQSEVNLVKLFIISFKLFKSNKLNQMKMQADRLAFFKLFYLLSFLYFIKALASWSGQDVLFLHFMPDKSSITSSIGL